MNPNYFHSVVLEPEECIGCTYCLKVCPTEAIRLKSGKASIMAERCIDCGECIRICPNHAKNSVTDKLDILKYFKYTIAIVTPVLYSQFSPEITPSKILSAVKSVGFDEICDTSIGCEIVNIVANSVIPGYKVKPVINSSCPAILRLIQLRFPELIDNILDVEAPAEITARLAKKSAVERTGLMEEDIGVILITPCTARVTSIKSPLGTDRSYIDGAVAIKDLYGSILRALYSGKLPTNTLGPTLNGLRWNTSGGQSLSIKGLNTLSVDGINNAISILEEIELGRLDNLSFIEITACPKGCIGGPLTVENKYIAINNINCIAPGLSEFSILEDDKSKYINMYSQGFIRFNRKIEPKRVSSLDNDIEKSIGKMDAMQSIINSLPGINCGICGSPTCHAFAEDIVMGKRVNLPCPVMILKNEKENE